MQIYSNQQDQSLSTVTPAYRPTNAVDSVATAASAHTSVNTLPSTADTVTLSAQAIALSKQPQGVERASNNQNPSTQPSTPILPGVGEKAPEYIEYRKAKAQYQIYSDIANMATGNNQGISPASAYYIANDEQTRSALVEHKAQQQQVAALQTYAQTTQSINETY